MNHLVEQANGFGQGWMAACPSNNSHTTFSNKQYTLGLKWRLGFPVLTDVSKPCAGCNQPFRQRRRRPPLLPEKKLLYPPERYSGSHFLNSVQMRPPGTEFSSSTDPPGPSPSPTTTFANNHFCPTDLLLDCWCVTDGK